jgi:type I restriction enzyme M protein
MAKITIEDLKSFLWSAAEDLRGQIDAAGYKEYIFPLLFFKRISDVYDEQYEAFVEEGGEEYAKMQARELPIRIPDGQHWKDVREVTEDVGQRLVEAFISIEQYNPARENDGRMVGGLDGIFGPKDGWTNKNKMPDYIITSIIENFSRYNLSLANCPADEMGQAYEYLVGKFADDAGNTAQEFYTNRTVVELMAEILQPQPNESIYDPTCGSGGMLIKSLDYLRNHGKEWQGVQVFGQEVNGLTSSIARMNLYLNGVEDFSIMCGDTLRNPAFIDGSRLRTFDMVLANPPYSIKEWDRAAFEHDKWGRNTYGTPPQARADYAFIQHIIASMDEVTGRCAILLPHGVLFRKEEREIRQKLISADILECVIGIGKNLFYNSGMDACIMICRKRKPEERKNKILFIDAHELVTHTISDTYMEPWHIEKVVDAYNRYEFIEGFAAVVDCRTINDLNKSKLSVKRYVRPPKESLTTTANEHYTKWKKDSEQVNENINRLLNCF